MMDLDDCLSEYIILACLSWRLRARHNDDVRNKQDYVIPTVSSRFICIIISSCIVGYYQKS